MQKLFKEVIQRSSRRWIIGFSVAALLVCASFGQVSTGKVENKNQSATPSQDRANLAHIQAGVLSGPVAFEVNRGQTDANVKFLTRAQNFTVFMKQGETVLRGRNADVLRMKLQNSNPAASVVGENRLQRISNYYIGSDRSKWLSGVPNYEKVRYENVYSGIDMVYHSDQQQLEYDFVVKPGADPNQIRVAFDGASKMNITSQGELELKSAAGDTLNHKPVVYQMINGHRKMVSGEYALANNTVGFKIGAYDRTQPLIIDPTLQVLSFFGGTLNDEAAGIAASAVQSSLTVAGIVFVGRSESPTLGGSAKPTAGINWDAFATGLNPGTAGVPAAAGTTVLWTTYFGGSGDDAARAVTLDNQGNVYVAGYTNSNNFPTAGQASTYDAFVAKLSASGSLTAAVLYGGPGVDQATSIALDYSTFSKLANPTSIVNPVADNRVVPNVIVGGSTSGSIGLAGSPANALGKVPDGNQTLFNTPQSGAIGTTDGFVAIFDNTLAFQHSTYIGGGGNDQVNGVAADIWGNIYATGFATPGVPAVTQPGATPTFFPVVSGIGNNSGVQSSTFDAAAAPQGAATAFVAKWACTTGTPPIGVPSPAPQIQACGGGNNLKTLSNSALFGGSALGNMFINPQQRAAGLPGITEAGLGIAVDQGSWGQQGVASVAGPFNSFGFPDIVPNNENRGTPCNTNATGFAIAGINAGKCAVSSTAGTQPTPPGNNNITDIGGFQPGLSGPHVYIVGNTASGDFVNGLINASCTAVPFTSNGGGPGNVDVPALCNTPEVWGSVVTGAGGLPTPVCDPANVFGGFCPAGAPTANIRIKKSGNSWSGQTQGWLVSFQFPAATQVVVQPPLTTTAQTVTTLAPPTIPNYIVLQPATCPQQNIANGEVPTLCLAGGVNNGFGAGSPTPDPTFSCTNGAGISCPTAFMGSWNGVAVDSDQQVYVVGQVGMVGAVGTFNAGAPTRLALEIERISPLSATINGGGTGFFSNLCGVSIPCAFPEPIFPSSAIATTSSFVVDAASPGSSYGQILPGAPPSPDPNQPGGLGNGIAVNQLRQAFFVGTTNVPAATSGKAATATATINAGAIVVNIATGGSGYAAGNVTLTVSGATCATIPGAFVVTVAAGSLPTGTVTGAAPNGNGAGCTGTTLTVAFSATPTAPAFPLTTTPISTKISPVPATQFNLGASGGQNAGGEDVLYGSIQFYDAIAAPNVVNFTATVNDPTSVFGPNSIVGNPATTGANAQAFVTYTNWEGQVLNIPPGCVVTPFLAGAGSAVFNVVQSGASAVFQVSVKPGAVLTPGVVSTLVAFQKAGPCTGAGQQALDSWDPITLTLTVSAPMNLVPENTFVITSKLASGVVDQYFAAGQQLVANQVVTSNVDVSTAASSGPINFTAQIVPGQNWVGTVATSIVVPTPTDIIYAAGGLPTAPTKVPVVINTQVLTALPIGTYTAYIMFTASPETPALPTSGSTACGSATIPVASGTTSAACVPIQIQITPNVTANIPTAIVFGASTTPQQTSVVVSNPGTTPYSFTGGYQPTPVFGTALPASAFSFVGTLTGCPSSVGASVAGTIAPGGLCSLPVQVNPAGLPTGVYSGQILLSNNGTASGATAQTTVPIIVYVGPKAGEDLPSGGGLGLMLPVNLPPVGTGGSQGTAPGTPGSYPLTIWVPSGVGPNGLNQIPNPTLVQVTGLSNTVATAFSLNAPTVTGLTGVSFTNVGSNFGTPATTCAPTYASLASLPGSPLGPPCIWSLWVDATSLNSTTTTTMAACNLGGATGRGETGTISFTPTNASFPMATLVVPVTICVSDFPQLTLGMPNTFPNPTFGPTTGTGFGGCNGGGVDCLLAQPSNLIPGFPLSITDMVLAISGGTATSGAVTASPINLQAQAGNSSQVCKILDIRTNGGVVPNTTIAPMGAQFITIQPLANVTGGAVFLGPAVGAPNSLPFNSSNGSVGFAVPGGIGGLGAIPGTPPFAEGPVTINPSMKTFAICVNTDPVGNAAGTFSSTVTINGAGVGAINIPVNMVIGQSGGTVTPDIFSQIGIFRPPTPVGGALGFFTLDSNGNYAFDASDKVRQFGLAGDYPVAGDWDGTGVVRLGVFRCPAPGAGICTWYLDNNNNGVWDGTFNGDVSFQFGLPGDIPVVGDWNGTGVSKVGVMRCPAAGQPGVCTWYLDVNNLRAPNGSFLVSSYGLAGDQPAIGNWAGQGGSKPVDNIGVFRNGTWFLNSSGSGFWAPTDTQYSYGVAGDVPVTGNWQGAANKRIGVFRCPAIGQPGTCTWILNTNGSGSFSATDLITSYGLPGDKPVVGFWTVQ